MSQFIHAISEEISKLEGAFKRLFLVQPFILEELWSQSGLSKVKTKSYYVYKFSTNVYNNNNKVYHLVSLDHVPCPVLAALYLFSCFISIGNLEAGHIIVPILQIRKQIHKGECDSRPHR